MTKIIFKENVNGFSGDGKYVICVQKNYPSSMKVVSLCLAEIYEWALDEYTVAIFRTKNLKQND